LLANPLEKVSLAVHHKNSLNGVDGINHEGSEIVPFSTAAP
jgi:hypothetical protein